MKSGRSRLKYLSLYLILGITSCKDSNSQEFSFFGYELGSAILHVEEIQSETPFGNNRIIVPEKDIRIKLIYDENEELVQIRAEDLEENEAEKLLQVAQEFLNFNESIIIAEGCKEYMSVSREYNCRIVVCPGNSAKSTFLIRDFR